MVILYLYAEIMGYQIPVFEEYVEKYQADVHVVHWNHKKLTPYVPPQINGVSFYNRTDFNLNNFMEFCSEICPDIIYVSGWMDKLYLKVVRRLKKNGIPIVVGFDDIWFNTFKQIIGKLIFPIMKRLYFSHAWVAGPYQYEYAKKLGFRNSEIIFNCLTADVKLFNKCFQDNLINKSKKYPKRFLYVGRFNKTKGLDILINAWAEISNEQKEWDLTIIGNGPMDFSSQDMSKITVIDFLQPEKLVEIAKDFGCLIIPSRNEPWGVVIHEFVALGLPIISSDICGANPIFVIHGYNGFIFKSSDIQDLKEKILMMSKMEKEALINFSKNSHSLGSRITPEISAGSFMSILNR
ncbi:MAG TPA: glycosyltransferase [Edaphocola sp.]|nr:glycosyltransferase [Edaphocola sp.]